MIKKILQSRLCVSGLEHALLRLLRCDCIATKHNGRIRDLVGAAAVLAPREDRHVSSPNQIAFAGILQCSPALAPVGYGYLLLHHGFSFGCSYTPETFQPTTEASSFTSFMPVFPMGFSRAIRLTSLAESERFELPKPFSLPR